MKPKFICDSCCEELKDLVEEDETIWVISDDIANLHLMSHNNCPKHIVLCDSCREDARDRLIGDEDWRSLEEWDDMHNYDDEKEFFDEYEKLIDYIIKLSGNKKNDD